MQNPASYEPGTGYLMLDNARWPGYKDYWLVHAKEHNPELQSRHTVVVNGLAKVQELLDQSPEVCAVFRGVHRALGLPPLRGKLKSKQPTAGKRCKIIHFLFQDATEEALFSWHSDDVGTDRIQMSRDMSTVVVNLSNEVSAMRLYGDDYQPHVFEKCGDACIFQGSALHESVPRRPESFPDGVLPMVHKIVFFFDV